MNWKKKYTSPKSGNKVRVINFSAQTTDAYKIGDILTLEDNCGYYERFNSIGWQVKETSVWIYEKEFELV